MNIHFHIERLILDGLPLEATRGPALQAAVEAELTRQLAASGLALGLQRSGALASASGGDLHLLPTTAPDELGTRIGQAIYEGINR